MQVSTFRHGHESREEMRLAWLAALWCAWLAAVCIIATGLTLYLSACAASWGLRAGIARIRAHRRTMPRAMTVTRTSGAARFSCRYQ